MVTKARGIQSSGLRRRPQSSSTGNPLTDMSITKGATTPNRNKAPAPIAIPDSGARRRQGSPRSPHSASPQSHSYNFPKSSPTRSSPTVNGFYAGAKFSEAPSAASLPKPPSHWTAGCHHDPFQAQSNQLKFLLKIQAWSGNPLHQSPRSRALPDLSEISAFVIDPWLELKSLEPIRESCHRLYKQSFF